MSAAPISQPDLLMQLSDDDFQAALLAGVSRTFALTIPQLPVGLFSAVANAYLLCRIVDTIEDEVSLSPRQKHYFCEEFIEVVRTGDNSEAFAVELAPLLSEQTIAAEHTLIHVLPRVIQITHSFAPAQIDALASCVATMAAGMPLFQDLNLRGGLATVADLDKYCYYVAGCVGEMLTKLFCHYSPEIAKHEQELMRLAVSFGQGLQMTNILKDIWDDAKRGVCWLPQEIFSELGYDLATLTPETDSALFRTGLTRLIAIAQGHLANALAYTELLPSHEVGMRQFCLWALGMAVLTLKKIRQNLHFNRSEQVKISRTSVKATIVTSRLLGRHNGALTFVFNVASRGLTTPDWHYSTFLSSADRFTSNCDGLSSAKSTLASSACIHDVVHTEGTQSPAADSNL